jgi:C4-dicarboxylate transporter DctQ subunit
MYNTGIGLDDLRYPGWMQETFGLQERVQRWVAYLMLPVGLSLLAFRSLQALFEIWRGGRELIIAGHEAEDLVAENKDILRD